MKSGWMTCIVAAFLALAFSAHLHAAEIAFMVGDVSVVRGTQKMFPDVHFPLKTGDLVATGRGSMATIGFEDGSTIRVFEMSRVRIGSTVIKDTGTVSVISGKINATFAKIRRENVRKVNTPTTVCSVRGTDFLVGVSEGADSRVELKEGSLDVQSPYGRVDLSPDQNVNAGLAESPVRDTSNMDMDTWKSGKDRELESDPEAKGAKYREYMDTLKRRNEKNGGSVSSYESRLKSSGMRNQKAMEKANSELNDLEDSAQNDILLNDTAGSSIDGILDRFEKDKKDMYDVFLRIKEESNRVREQQQANYRALQEVRESYRKAYADIMNSYKQSIDGIKGRYDREAVKPK